MNHTTKDVEILLDAYVHCWDAVGDSWTGTGWKQPVRILIGDVGGGSIAPVLPLDISDGRLGVGTITHDNLVRLPFNASDAIRLWIQLTNADVVEVIGSRVQIDVLGEARFVEDLAADLRLGVPANSAWTRRRLRARPDEVYKNPNDVDLTVNPDGTISVPDWFDWLKQKGQEYFDDGGWNDGDFLEERHNGQDHDWDDLFDKAKPKDLSGRKDRDPGKSEMTRRRIAVALTALLLLIVSTAAAHWCLLDGLDGWLLSTISRDDTSYAPRYSTRGFRSISVGMTLSTVADRLGQPLAEIWTYQRGGEDYLVVDIANRHVLSSRGPGTPHTPQVKVGVPAEDVMKSLGVPVIVSWVFTKSMHDSSYRMRTIVFRDGRVDRTIHDYYWD